MQLPEDEDLLYIAREGLKAPIPPDWKPCKLKNSEEVYYFNFKTGESVWQHPCDRYYSDAYKKAKQEKIRKAQDQASSHKKRAEQEEVAELIRAQKAGSSTPGLAPVRASGGGGHTPRSVGGGPSPLPSAGKLHSGQNTRSSFSLGPITPSSGRRGSTPLASLSTPAHQRSASAGKERVPLSSNLGSARPASAASGTGLSKPPLGSLHSKGSSAPFTPVGMPSFTSDDEDEQSDGKVCDGEDDAADAAVASLVASAARSSGVAGGSRGGGVTPTDASSASRLSQLQALDASAEVGHEALLQVRAEGRQRLQDEREKWEASVQSAREEGRRAVLQAKEAARDDVAAAEEEAHSAVLRAKAAAREALAEEQERADAELHQAKSQHQRELAALRRQHEDELHTAKSDVTASKRALAAEKRSLQAELDSVQEQAATAKRQAEAAARDAATAAEAVGAEELAALKARLAAQKRELEEEAAAAAEAHKVAMQQAEQEAAAERRRLLDSARGDAEGLAAQHAQERQAAAKAAEEELAAAKAAAAAELAAAKAEAQRRLAAAQEEAQAAREAAAAAKRSAASSASEAEAEAARAAEEAAQSKQRQAETMSAELESRLAALSSSSAAVAAEGVQLAELKGKVAALQDQVQSLGAAVEEERTAHGKTRATLAEARALVRAAEERAATAEASAATAESRCNSATQARQAAEERAVEAESQASAARAASSSAGANAERLASLRREVTEARSQRDALERKVSALDAELAATHSALSQAKAAAREASFAVPPSPHTPRDAAMATPGGAATSAALSDAEAYAASLRRRLVAADETAASLQARLAGALAGKAEAEAQLAGLTAEIAGLREQNERLIAGNVALSGRMVDLSAPSTPVVGSVAVQSPDAKRWPAEFAQRVSMLEARLHLEQRSLQVAQGEVKAHKADLRKRHSALARDRRLWKRDADGAGALSPSAASNTTADEVATTKRMLRSVKRTLDKQTHALNAEASAVKCTLSWLQGRESRIAALQCAIADVKAVRHVPPEALQAPQPTDDTLFMDLSETAGALEAQHVASVVGAAHAAVDALDSHLDTLASRAKRALRQPPPSGPAQHVAGDAVVLVPVLRALLAGRGHGEQAWEEEPASSQATPRHTGHRQSPARRAKAMPLDPDMAAGSTVDHLRRLRSRREEASNRMASHAEWLRDFKGQLAGLSSSHGLRQHRPRHSGSDW
ncbi:Cep164 [Symbiodinium sp. KB8]|nr:Cep164 [Symbiodinium sp. KB8]